MLTVVLCLSSQKQKKKFVTSTLYPVVTVTLTSVQWQWIKVTLTSYTLTDTHISASTPLHVQTQMQTCIHKPSSSVSVCDWLVLVPCPADLTSELEAAPPPPPIVPLSWSLSSQLSFMLASEDKLQFSPFSSSFCPALLYSAPSLFASAWRMNRSVNLYRSCPRPPTCLSPPCFFLPILFPSRQTGVLALLQIWKWHGGLSLDRMMMMTMIIILILMKNKWFLFRWTARVVSDFYCSFVLSWGDI